MTWYAWFIIIEDGVMHAFKKRRALAPETAATKSELGLESAALFNYLVAKGVIKKAAPDRYFMDVGEQSRYLSRRRWTVAFVVVGLVGLTFLLAAIRD